jgi:hypothetical protein
MHDEASDPENGYVEDALYNEEYGPSYVAGWQDRYTLCYDPDSTGDKYIDAMLAELACEQVVQWNYRMNVRQGNVLSSHNHADTIGRPELSLSTQRGRPI